MVRTRHAGSLDGDIFVKSHTSGSRIKREVMEESHSSDSDVIERRKRIKVTKGTSSITRNSSASGRNKSEGMHLVLSDSDVEVNTYTSRSGRKIVNNKLFSDFDSHYYKKTRHSTPDLSSPKKSDCQNFNSMEKLNHSSIKIGKTPIVRNLRSSSRISKNDLSDPVINGDLALLDDDSSIRRSTRQRKVVYDTLNQSWLLGTTTSGAAFRNGSENQTSNSNFEDVFKDSDMYSRVKERRMKNQAMFADVKQKKSSVSTDDDEPDNQSDRLSSCEENEVSHSKYHLRPKKPLIKRFQPSEIPRRTRSSIFNHTSSPARRTYPRSYRSSHGSPIFKSKRHATHNNSSTSSSSDDEMRFERRKKKSMIRARNRFLPMNMANEDIAIGTTIRDRVKIGSSLADVDPMSLDKSITFESVGGLDRHLDSLKEMVLFPLLYPEIFEKFNIPPPRGVLFYGPPGTGKTLVARALANECSHSNHKVAFFMRKGADCLSKWVGESERQLRLLFDQAYAMRPSIIFFDEIDGLAPVRSSRQDQIHSSIVSTLLALMDGLDNRGEVIVIGATNRIDAIDPALRRPGRFDREFNFSLPTCDARNTILKIHTKDWNPPLDSSFVAKISKKCVGYCGADLKSLCAEAALLALRRRYPQIYNSREKLLLNVSLVKIQEEDFELAMQKIVPASHRAISTNSQPLSSFVKPFMNKIIEDVTAVLLTTFPQGFKSQEVSSNTSGGSGLNDKDQSIFSLPPHCFRPKLILCGNKEQGQSTHLGPAILHLLEGISIHSLDLPNLYADCLSSEESCTRIFKEAKRNTPSVIYLPHIDQWWTTVSETLVAIFVNLLSDMPPASAILLLATSDCDFDQLPIEIQSLFKPYKKEVLEMRNPTISERRDLFEDLFVVEAVKLPISLCKSIEEPLEKLEIAPPVEPRKLSEPELLKLQRQEENTLRELRMFLRETINKLVRDRKFLMFAKPVDLEEVPDYMDVISHPMDLETMMQKIDLHKYETGQQFLEDIDLICSNALEYNPDKGPSDRLIRHRACALRDVAYDILETEMDPEFEKTCIDIHNKRLKRGDSPTKYAPKHYITVNQIQQQHDEKDAQTVSDSEVGKKVLRSSSNKRHTTSYSRCRTPWFGSRGKRRILKPKHTTEDNLKVQNDGNDDEKLLTVPIATSSTPSQESQSANHNASVSKPYEENCLNSNDDLEEKSSDQSDDPELIIDNAHLGGILDDIVAFTDDFTIEVLENFHAVLKSCVQKYNAVWDRTSMLKELENEVIKFKESFS